MALIRALMPQDAVVAIMKFIVVIAMPRNDNFMRLLVLAFLVIFITLPVQALEVSRASGNLLLSPSHGGGEAWGKKTCSSCHVLQRMHKNVPNIKTIVDRKKFVTCTGCHGTNGTTAIRECLVCHNPKDLPEHPIRTGKHRHDFNLKKDLPTTSAQCVVCHAGSDMDGKFVVSKDLTLLDDKLAGKQPYVDVNDFCLRCHNRTHQQKKHPIKNAGKRDQSINAEDDYLHIDKHGVTDGSGEGVYNGLRSGRYNYKTIVDCVDCHTMHGTTNHSLILDDSRKGAFLLDQEIRKTPYKVEVFGNSDYSQLCVLCHSMKQVIHGGDSDTGNGLSGVHFNFGSDCVTCHNHGERVQKGL